MLQRYAAEIQHQICLTELSPGTSQATTHMRGAKKRLKIELAGPVSWLESATNISWYSSVVGSFTKLLCA